MPKSEWVHYGWHEVEDDVFLEMRDIVCTEGISPTDVLAEVEGCKAPATSPGCRVCVSNRSYCNWPARSMLSALGNDHPDHINYLKLHVWRRRGDPVMLWHNARARIRGLERNLVYSKPLPLP